MKTKILFLAIVLSPVFLYAQKTKCNPIVSDSVYEFPSHSEIQSLQFMREEEILAGDIYKLLFQKYNLPVFSNISKSEDVHTSRIKILLDKYGIEDPGINHKSGIFKSASLQSLYNQLVQQSETSLIEAFKAAIVIEEKDIYDLSDAISNKVNNKDILLVYNNLKRASGNHLRAFTNHLKTSGILYIPIYLSEKELAQILVIEQY